MSRAERASSPNEVTSRNFAEIDNAVAPVDRPVAVALRPFVDIARREHAVDQPLAVHLAQIGGDIGLAACAVAIDVDDDVGHLVRMVQEIEVGDADRIDPAAPGALVGREVGHGCPHGTRAWPSGTSSRSTERQ